MVHYIKSCVRLNVVKLLTTSGYRSWIKYWVNCWSIHHSSCGVYTGYDLCNDTPCMLADPKTQG